MQSGEDFNRYIDAFGKKLEIIEIDRLNETNYCNRYLKHILQHQRYYLAIYADVLNKLIWNSKKKKEDILLVDIGSGNGLLGIFAKFCGFKKVVLNDLDKTFIEASEKLATQLNIKLDAYITGDIDAVQNYFSQEQPDSVVGTDVIEHIYDLEIFFKTLQQINPSIVSVFTTASNPSNPFKVRQLQKIQVRDELKGGSPGDHQLFGETTLEPFVTIREKIIREFEQGLTENEILKLSTLTRGLVKADIISVVEKYKSDRILPVNTAGGTNTCNPMNGSWTERLLSLDTYISLYASAGFTCDFYAGFYNDHEKGMKNFVKKLLNALGRVFGKKISPYIVIVGHKI